MLAKVWKKVLLIILLVACLFNIVSKLVVRLPFLKEMEMSAIYTLKNQPENNTENKQNNI